MQGAQSNRALSMNLDKSRKILSAEECFFLLNNERYLDVSGNKKGSLAETGPLVANRPACEMEHPQGENYAVGKYYSNLTNELYSWVYNSNGVHWIQRIKGDGECEIVYDGDCPLPLSAFPKNSIEQFRAYLQLDKLCANRHGKSLVWVTGEGTVYQLDVEASIATNSFRTPFFDRCADPCDFIRMCVPDPCGCLKGEFMPLDPNDAGKKNNIVDVGLKFSYIHYYYDNRASIWAEPSTLFYQDTKGCFDNPDGFPRCIKLRVPVGNPLVEKIGIAFWKNGVWYMTEIVEKYKKYNNSQQMWYERDLSEIVASTFSDEDCAFDYIFCNDKLCDTIDAKEFSRVYNPMPINPQGILPIGIGQDRTALGFYNYEQGNCPIDKTEVEKLKIGIDCPVDNCNPEYATVKVRLVVHNRIHNRNQPVFRLNGSAGGPDDPSDPAYFGGLNKNGSGDLELGHDQRFSGKTRNFIVYVEGTDSWAEMKQWKSHAFYVNKEFWGMVNDMAGDKNRWRRAAKNGEFFYQEAEIKVIKGTRGFLRISSHQSTGNSQDTSTFVIGTQNLYTYKGDSDLSDGFTAGEEIYFDTCNGDVDISNAFVVDDNAIDAGFTTGASSYNGYVRDKNGRPVEGAVVEIDGNECITDHNGFYHTYIYPGTDSAVNANVNVEQDCFTFSTIKTDSIQGEHLVATKHDINIDSQTYADSSYAKVKMQVNDCQGHPVGGVRVALSGSKYDITNANGFAEFKIRNYETRNRQLRAVVMNNNGCFSIDCNNVCNPCMPTNTVDTTPIGCFVSVPSITFPSVTINRTASLLSKKGLKAGGRYPFGFYARGDCGMISAVNEIAYIDIPRTQEKGKEGFCSFTYDATGITLPSWVKCVDIVRGENINPFELQWVVDKIERVDGKIKLTIQSLNDYNEKYFFKTNTIYQWLKGDRVEFIKNGDGKVFSISQFGLLNYLTISPFHDEQISGQTEAAADYFNQILIDDDGKLDTLKEGAIIELQRSKECTTQPVYYGICVSIPVVNGKMLYETGTFETFDTYFVKRTIGKLPAQQFESKYPSDFWGNDGTNTGLSDIGRAYFINKFENKRRYGRNITINAPNVFNYFGDLVRTLENDSHGDLIAVWLTDNQVMLAISEHDNSLHQVGNDLLNVGRDGLVRAVSTEQLISPGQPKVSGTYGCQYPHIGSIHFGDGWVSWVDVNKHTHVVHDYQNAVPADEGKAQTYFRRRCQEIETFNRSAADPLDHYRFATGQNMHTGALHITVKKLRHDGIYNEIAPFLKGNDTIMYHPVAKDYMGFASFTPEAYGQLNLFDGKGCAFVAFLNSIPYIHPIIPDKWNEFFGVAVDRVVGISLNKAPEKIKKGVSIEIQDETMWFVADVSTENTNFRSEIPAVRWKKDRNKWNASFLNDINSRGGLYNGRGTSGYYHAITFVRDNTDALKYGTTDNAKRVKYDSLDMIHFKFEVIEQSGFDQNL